MTEVAVQSWLNKGTNTIPDWAVPGMVGKRDPNGAFLISTMCGLQKATARVLVGNLLIERKGILYTRHPSEARGFLAELDEKESGAYAALPKQQASTTSAKPSRAEADVADRSDDTDDISRRIARATSVKELDRRIAIAAAPTIIAQSSAVRAAIDADRAPKPKANHKPALGAMPSIEWVQLERLLVDDSYQRSIETGPSRALIARIGKEWDWRLCVPLMVSRRQEGLFVIDGQHRLYGARQRVDIPQLPCCISVYDGPAAEAAMFVAANRERRAMNRLDDFHAAIAAGDTDAHEVQRLVEAAGFTVARTTGSQTWRPGEVAFTSAIRTVLRKHGEAHVAEILRALAEAFPGQVLVTGGSLFNGLSRIIVTPPEGLDKARLFLALKRFDAKGWASMIEGMEGGTDRSSAMRDALLMAYEEAPERIPA